MSRSYHRSYERRQFANKFVRTISSGRLRRKKIMLPDGNYYRKLTNLCGQDIYEVAPRRKHKIRKYVDGKRIATGETWRWKKRIQKPQVSEDDE